MYQALYRKWRPQTFDAVVGQQHITETLKNQVITGRLSHAYLFIGTRGTGKTTCARILARAVNCEHPVNGNPCGVCPACRGISEGTVMDVVELDAASNNGVDNVRALREEAVFSPAAVKKRVYIIDEVHMLSTPAFNALLKILEEPPEHLMFILATTELQKVPATILSRCQRHSFRRIDTAQIAQYLEYISQQEHFSITRDAAELIARLAEGGVRDALSLLDQCSAATHIDVDAVYSAMGLAGNRRTVQLLNDVLDKKTETVLKSFNSLWMDGKDPATLLGELMGLIRDTMVMRVAPKSASSLISGSFDSAELKTLTERMTTEETLCAMETLQKALGAMRDTKSPKTTAELCLVSLCDNTLGESTAELRARISRLEEQVKNGAVSAPANSGANTAYESGEPPFGYDEPPFDYDEPPSGYCEPGVDSPSQREPEPEFEPIDPSQFMEEQPEDSFLSKAAPKQQANPEVKTVDNIDVWKAVCAKVAHLLPPDMKAKLNDTNLLRGAMENGVLKIYAAPGFIYGRFSRQEILAKFSSAASEVCGKEVNAVAAELKAQTAQETRSLEELKQFKEVRFI